MPDKYRITTEDGVYEVTVGDEQQPSGTLQTLRDIADIPRQAQIGAVKGIANTAYGLTGLVNRGIRALGPDIEQYVPPMPPKPQFLEPEGMAQKAGYGAEQAGEFLIPGGAEEAIAAKAGRLAPLARIAASGVGAGGVSAAQGGSFGTGALVGGAASGIAQAAKALAPSVAESALGIARRARTYGKTPGRAILEETTGILPSTVEEQALKKSLALTKQLEAATAASTSPTSVQPALDVIDREMQTAVAENVKPYYDQLQVLRDQLTHDFNGQPLPISNRPASDILNAKRGIGKLISRWNPEEQRAIDGVKKQVYHALDQQLDNAVPGAKQINQRISSLIPVKERAEITAESAGVPQRVAHRIAAHTGALAGSIGGGYFGYQRGGLGGAVAGGIAGAVLPELIAAPTTQITAARAMRNLAVPSARFGTGLALQLDRERNLLAPEEQ